jgi:heat-inducible transcriptional repressor
MNLDRRKQSLLEAIVVAYVDRAEPVGSHFLASDARLGVRSATIRNELAEMTDLGYLRQPHTSAGRIPSDMGYRYYVDHLMTWERLAPGDARTIRTGMKVSEGDVEQLLTQTCRILSSLTRYTSVVTAPASAEPVLRQVLLAQVTPTRLLSVAVLDNGHVVHRFCETTRSLSPSEVTRVGNALAELIVDLPASKVRQVSPVVEEMTQYEEVLRSLIGIIASGMAGEDGEIYMEGASRILDQPEFRESDRVEPLVRFLEQRKTAFETLQKLLSEENVKVSIGHEHPHEAMREVSMVAARYSAGNRSHGWVAVLGPTRMHYAQALPAVQYAARALSETLARLGLD